MSRSFQTQEVTCPLNRVNSISPISFIVLFVIFVLFEMFVFLFALIEIPISANISFTVPPLLYMTGYKKYEDWQFKKAGVSASEIPAVMGWSLVILTLSFLGAEALCGLLLGLVLVMTLSSPVNFISETIEWLMKPTNLSLVLFLKALVYFATAYCASRVITRFRYTQILIAALLALIVQPIIVITVETWFGQKLEDSRSYLDIIYYVFVIMAVFLGAKLAVRPSPVKEQV